MAFYECCAPVRRGKTCHWRFFEQWRKAGVFRRIVEVLDADLQERSGIDLQEAFIDGRFVPVKKGAMSVFLLPSALQVLRRLR